MITAKELIEKLKNVDGSAEVRIVSQCDSETGDTYHNEVNDVYVLNEEGEDVVVLASDEV